MTSSQVIFCSQIDLAYSRQQKNAIHLFKFAVMSLLSFNEDDDRPSPALFESLRHEGRPDVEVEAVLGHRTPNLRVSGRLRTSRFESGGLVHVLKYNNFIFMLAL